MSIRGFRILWLRIEGVNSKHFGFAFPIPLYIFKELMDCFLDLLALASLFVPRRSRPGSFSGITVQSLRQLIKVTMKLFDSFTECEPYELVDVTSDKIRVSIKIR